MSSEQPRSAHGGRNVREARAQRPDIGWAPQGSLLLPWVEPRTYVHPRGISILTLKAGQGVRLALQAARMYTPLPAAKATSTHCVGPPPEAMQGTHTQRPAPICLRSSSSS